MSVGGGIAAIGGGATSFLPQAFPPPALSSLFVKCQAQVQARQRKNIPFFPARFEGANRQGALFCRSGTWMEILDQRTAELEYREKRLRRPEFVRGSRESTHFSILEFISLAFGLVSIRGRDSQRYLCMDREGRLYAAKQDNYSYECIFMEEMLENYYNLYSSCAHSSKRRPWYVALRRTGHPRKGKNARKRRKSSHFLVVHLDTAAERRSSLSDNDRRSSRFGFDDRDRRWRLDERNWRSEAARRNQLPTYGYSNPPVDLGDILEGTLRGQPPRTPFTMQTSLGRTTPRSETRESRRRRQRKQRLEREEQRRKQRREELERLRQGRGR